MSAEALFRWASVSKPLTAIAAMQLVDSVRLALSDIAFEHRRKLPRYGVGSATVEQSPFDRSGVGHYLELGD